MTGRQLELGNYRWRSMLTRTKLFNRRQFMQVSAAGCGGLLLASKGDGQTEPEIHICLKSRPPAKTLYVVRFPTLGSRVAVKIRTAR